MPLKESQKVESKHEPNSFKTEKRVQIFTESSSIQRAISPDPKSNRWLIKSHRSTPVPVSPTKLTHAQKK